MEFMEYVEKFKQAAHEKLGYPLEKMLFIPKGFETTDPEDLEWINRANVKLNGVKEDIPLTDVLVLVGDIKDGVGIVQRVDIRHCYEQYGDDLDSALEEVQNTQKAVDMSFKGSNIFEKRSSGDYEKMRDTLILRPLNYSHYAPLLDEHIYRRYGDIALVLYMLVGDAGDSLTTSKIKREELDKWGVSTEQAIDDALANTARLFPACVCNIRLRRGVDLLKGNYAKKDVSFLNRIILISTFRTTNGAVALFYPGVLDKMMKVMGGPFEAVFMNINDVLIFAPGDAVAVEMAELARERGPYEELLSGSRYLCDSNGIRIINSDTPQGINTQG